MLPLTLFRSRDFSGANLMTFFLYTALGGSLFFVPLNLIQVQGYSATAAGAASIPFILILFLLSRWAGGLVQKHGAKLPLVSRPDHCGFRVCIVYIPRHRRQLLDHFLSAGGGAGFRDGGERCALNDNGHERGAEE